MVVVDAIKSTAIVTLLLKYKGEPHRFVILRDKTYKSTARECSGYINIESYRNQRCLSVIEVSNSGNPIKKYTHRIKGESNWEYLGELE